MPEVTWDFGRKSRPVFRDALRSAGTRDDGRRGRMSERELQRRSFDGNLVALREGLDALDLREDLRGRPLVLEVGAADQDARAVRATNITPARKILM